MRRCVWSVCVLMVCVLAAPLRAATVAGRVTDATGAGVPGARVVLKDQATGKEEAVETNADGRYELSAASAGSFLLVVTRQGFAEAARTIVVKSAEERLAADVRLEIGPLGTDVSVTAARSEREIRRVPLHVDTMTAAAISQSNALSTGDALSSIANVTPVGNGPFGVRPRLRGLDSTRLLVLVDGERLNTARQATDRTGAEVGLVVARNHQPRGDRERGGHADVRQRRAVRHDQHHHQRTGAHAAAQLHLRPDVVLQHE